MKVQLTDLDRLGVNLDLAPGDGLVRSRTAVTAIKLLHKVFMTSSRDCDVWIPGALHNGMLLTRGPPSEPAAGGVPPTCAVLTNTEKSAPFRIKLALQIWCLGTPAVRRKTTMASGVLTGQGRLHDADSPGLPRDRSPATLTSSQDDHPSPSREGPHRIVVDLLDILNNVEPGQA